MTICRPLPLFLDWEFISISTLPCYYAHKMVVRTAGLR
jgi:hypothetical protein